MNVPVFSIQDTMIGFNAPFIMVNEEAAKRAYINAEKKDPDSKDKRLFVIGSFDDETGSLQPVTPYQIMGGIEHE